VKELEASATVPILGRFWSRGVDVKLSKHNRIGAAATIAVGTRMHESNEKWKFQRVNDCLLVVMLLSTVNGLDMTLVPQSKYLSRALTNL